MFCKKALILTVLSLLVVCTVMATTTPNSSAPIQQMNQMPLSFTKNMGQWDDRVLYRANSGGATMWFTKEGVTYQFTRRVAGHSREGGNPGSVGRTFLSDPGQAGMPILPGDRYEKDSVEQLVLTARFVGANPNPEVIGESQMEYKCNYFLGNNPSKWHTDVPNYSGIMLKDIYPGIDLRYSGDGTGQAAYEFIAAPGADVAQIKFEYEGAEGTSIDSDGRLILTTKWGDITAAMYSPRPVGEGSGVRAVLSGSTSCAWWTSASTTSTQDLAHGDVRQARQVVSFETAGASGQALGTLSVVLSYSTYLGGSSWNYGSGFAVDGSGNAYVTGYTQSTNFPTQDPYQSTFQGVYDVFVTKLSSSGNTLLYSTYLGGEGNDMGYALAVDGSGNAYVTGFTQSNNFPTLDPYQTYQGGLDAFVTKLSSSGNSLIYSTYLGGGNEDHGLGIAVDGNGNAYVTGETWSANFPTQNPYQTWQGISTDAFVTKLSSTGNSLIYSTFLGGESGDRGLGIAVDGNGNAYVTGVTQSGHFPTQNPFQTDQAFDDAFVTKLNGSGNSLVYSTYLAGSSQDEGHGIAVDGSGNAYVAGVTSSTDFPTQNPYQSTINGSSWNVFITKLSYTAGTDYVITPTPNSADVFFVKQADIDGDNYTDVIYTGNTTEGLYIAYGKADGTLETPRKYLNVTKAALAVDFVNNDLLLDVVATIPGQVYVLLNDGNRNFTVASQTVGLSSWGSDAGRSSVFPSIATGYFNNDAHLDIVVSENKILFGNGSGSFPTSATLPFSFDAVDVSDFDRNGTDDIVTTYGDSAFIYLNDGSGNLTRSAALLIGYHTHDFTNVKAGMDLNNDGKTDFVMVTGNTVGTNDTSVVTIALGDGTGGVASSDTLCIVGTALNLALADVDKDHDLDISLVNATTRSLLIILNDGLGSFAPPVSISLGSGTNPLYALISADLDRNGAPDFVIGGQAGNSILSAVNQISSDPILHDEMVTTGYDNVTLRVENPLGLVISRPLSTVAGSAYWRKDVDNSGVLDESAYDYNLQNGEYKIVIESKTNVGSGPSFSMGIRIDGTAERNIFASYMTPPGGGNLVFYYQVEPVSSIYPANGHPTANPQPTFSWSGLVGKERVVDSYEFQLDRYYDFRSPIFSVTGLTSPQYHIPHSLGADSVFYWRIRPVTGGTTGAYSRTFAAFLLNYLCGDANADATADISDAVYLIAYIFSGGSAPSPLLAGDANCDSTVDISDAVYLIAYIFSGGAAPCAGCK